MSKVTQFKSVVVKEDPKTSLAEAGINRLKLPNGTRITAIGHVYFPNHDRNMTEQVLKYVSDSKSVVIGLGGLIDEEAFKAIGEDESNFLHDYPDSPEIRKAMETGGFEDQILALGESCGDFIKSIQKASGSKFFYLPSATHLSMGNEVRRLEWIEQVKRHRDARSSREISKAMEKEDYDYPSDLPSDPTRSLPRRLDELLGLKDEPLVQVLRFGSAILVNGKYLFMIGDFRRRHPGDAALIEWEQRGLNIIRSFDGKVASGWFTNSGDTVPAPKLNYFEAHEVGYLWDPVRMGHLRDYDRRASGFWTGVVVDGEIFGQAVPIIRGKDGRRSFVVDGKVYTEDKACCLPRGEELSLAPASKSTKAKAPAKAKSKK